MSSDTFDLFGPEMGPERQPEPERTPERRRKPKEPRPAKESAGRKSKPRRKTIEPSRSAADDAEGVTLIPLDQIDPNPYPVRRVVDEVELQRLQESIATHGMLQLITVRPGADGRFIVMKGDRRLRACRALEIDSIPARVVVPASEEEAEDMTISAQANATGATAYEWCLTTGDYVQKRRAGQSDSRYAAIAPTFACSASEISRRVKVHRDLGEDFIIAAGITIAEMAPLPLYVMCDIADIRDSKKRVRRLRQEIRRRRGKPGQRKPAKVKKLCDWEKTTSYDWRRYTTGEWTLRVDPRRLTPEDRERLRPRAMALFELIDGATDIEQAA